MTENPTEYSKNSTDKEMNEMVSKLLSAFPELIQSHDKTLQKTQRAELSVEKIMALPDEKLSKFNRFLRKLVQCYSTKDILQTERALLKKETQNPTTIQSYYGKLRAHELQLVASNQLGKEEFESHWQTILLHEINRSVT